MEKKLCELLQSLSEQSVAYSAVSPDGTDSGTAQAAEQTVIESLAFDSRDVSRNSLFFALPGTHTTGNKFIASAIRSGAVSVIFQDEIAEEEQAEIASAAKSAGRMPVFIKVASSRFAMSPVSSAFYDYPSKKLVVYGVTGTEGKSSTVSFVWQLLRSSGIKAGFISTVQYSLGAEAIDNPQHQTTPEAPVVQRELYEMVCNGCTHAVVEASSHGLSRRTNRLGDVLFDCGIFMNVTLEHLEFHKTYDQYKSDKANLFRALDAHSHEKILCGKKTQVPVLGIVNLEDPAASYFASCTKHTVAGFTTEGKAGKQAAQGINAPALPEIPKDMPFASCRNIVSARFGINFSIHRFESFGSLKNESPVIQVKAPVPGAFNAYNITAALLAVHGMEGIPMETLAGYAARLESVKGRMTAIDEGQPFEVIVDYAHTPSSFETIFPPVRNRCAGNMICVFGSGGERDTKKRPLQGEIAAKFCNIVILTDEDPRKEDRMEIISQIAAGARKAGKTDGKDLLLIPDRPAAIRKAFSLAKKDDIVLLLGKSHENSIIYEDRVMSYDEIAEAKKALAECCLLKEKSKIKTVKIAQFLS
ncbi:MAG: UDP-N-acetylmuramoyl-L-alanyl-D-glutamate--2,6-diaminopimelate ligase [Treponema sp.]|nr:UDP-N-acetylmuramoyl-L-alanyl-D-glutamate--2,6-diaminopimelate ligase [Treponema sp.]